MEKKIKDIDELGFETLRATIDIINEDERSFSCVAASDKAILLQGYKYSDTFETFTEVLSFDNGAMQSERLDVGLPLFPSHWRRESTDQLGITTGYRTEANNLIVDIKLGARADDVLWSDIKNGITKTVSLGFDIHSVRRELMNDKPQYRVISWNPKHVAFAPEPADVNCTVRSMAQVEGQIIPEIKEEKDILKKLFTK